MCAIKAAILPPFYAAGRECLSIIKRKEKL